MMMTLFPEPNERLELSDPQVAVCVSKLWMCFIRSWARIFWRPCVLDCGQGVPGVQGLLEAMAPDSSIVPSINLEQEELRRKLVDFGNALLDPPASGIELLQLLEEFQHFLSGIPQEDKLLPALGPARKALIGDQLLRHADTDVQTAVLSCINEISRITAPFCPYEDSEMKEFFLLLVQSLKRFSSMNDRCYAKAVSILETVAGTKSCIVMLDLDMDAIILEMFQTFLTSIQLRPSPGVFSDMVTIMQTLMEECIEGIPVDLLRALLASVKKDRKDVSPISWDMGVEILQKSARLVRRFFTNLVQSLEIDLNDYAEIVASICQNAAQVENTTGQELPSDTAGPNGQLVDGPSKSLENNPTTQDMDSISSEQRSLKMLQFGNQITELTENATVERDDRPLKDENSPKDLNFGPEKEKNTAVPRTISKTDNMTIPGENNHGAQDMDHDISSEQNASKTLQFHNQSTQLLLADNVSSRRNASPLKDENSLKVQTSGVIKVQEATDLETISGGENVNVNNAVPQENNDGVKVPEKRERKPNSLFRLEEGYLFAGRTAESVYLESCCGWNNYKRRSDRPSGRKSDAVSSENKSSPDEKPCKEKSLKKKGHIINQHDLEQKQLSLPSPLVCGKRSRGKSASPAKCDQESVLETSSEFDIVLASHLTTKTAPESESKAQSSLFKEEASRLTYGEKLVGCKIKVWWPLDQEYYEGVVDSFDLSTTEHKVIYDDGDVEILKLMLEDWELVKEAALLDGQEKAKRPASSELNFSDGPSSKKQKGNGNDEDIPEVAGASMEQVEN